jgi:outer membrane receptor protein involved in Fe transport
LYYTDRANASNDSLKAEQARYVSFGIKRRARFSYEAYVFYRSIKDFVSYARENENEKWTPNNIAQVNMKGLNVNGNYQFCQWSSINFAYTFLMADFVASNATDFKYSYEHAKHRVVVSLNQNIGKHLSQTFSYRYVERFNANHYQVLDYRMNYQLTENIRAYADIMNVFNTAYYDRVVIPMPARWLRLGVHVAF